MVSSVVGGDGKADFTPEPARRFTTDVAPVSSFDVKSAKLTAIQAREQKTTGSTGSRDKEIMGRYSAPPRQPPPARKTLTNPIRNIVEESRIHQDATYGTKKEEIAAPRVAELRATPRYARLNNDIKPHVIFSQSKNSEAKKTSSNTSEPLDRVDGKEAKTIDISAEQSPSLSNYSEGVGEHKIQVNQRKVILKNTY